MTSLTELSHHLIPTKRKRISKIEKDEAEMAIKEYLKKSVY